MKRAFDRALKKSGKTVQLIYTPDDLNLETDVDDVTTIGEGYADPGANYEPKQWEGLALVVTSLSSPNIIEVEEGHDGKQHVPRATLPWEATPQQEWFLKHSNGNVYKQISPPAPSADYEIFWRLFLERVV